MIMEEMAKEFKLKDLGQVKQFMGLNIEVNNDAETLTIDRTRYIDKIL